MRLAIRSLSFLGYILLGLAVWPWAVWIRVHFTSGHLAHQERLEKFLAAFPSAVSSARRRNRVCFGSTLKRAIVAALATTLFASCSLNEIGSEFLGIPRPEEWEERRAEFIRRLPQSRVVVLPPEVVGQGFISADLIAADIGNVAASAVAVATPANVAPAKIGPTSYRYVPRRLGQYSAWTRQSRLDADYFFFIEIYTGRVPGAQIIVIDGHGVPADLKRIHWGGAPASDDDDVAAIIKRCYVEALFAPVQSPCPGGGLS